MNAPNGADGEDPYAEPRGEYLAYGVAIAILVGFGMLLRTPILNWISGPSIVIATVSILGPIFARRRKAKSAGTGAGKP